MFANRSSPIEPKKPSWRFFTASSPTPPLPPVPHLRTAQSSSSVPSSAKGHYRTHSSIPTTSACTIDETAATSALGSGVQVVRTPSEARRGCMKVRPAHSAPVLPSIPQTAELPMMEECDRRVSFSAVLSNPSVPAVPTRIVHKSSSLAALGSREKERSRRSLIPPLPHPIAGTAKPHRVTVIPPSTRTLSTIVPVPPLPFSATLLDITQRPAPSAANQILLKIEFGFSLDERSSSTAGITIPLEMLQRCGGSLDRFVQGHLEEMRDRADKAAEEDWGMRIVSDVPSFGSRPGMTDGESGTDSDLDSEEYGSSALLRDEYLKSVWESSPTATSFGDLPPIPAKSPARTSQYYTPPKKRAYVRNQYTQQSPFPTPSSPHMSSTAPLAIRRRATYLVLPSTEPRGHIIEIKVLLMRDAASWHHIAARLVQGAWARMDERRAQGVIGELRWAGMEGLLAELLLSSESAPVEAQAEMPPVPKLETFAWDERRHKRMSSKSCKGDVSGVKGGGAGYL